MEAKMATKEELDIILAGVNSAISTLAADLDAALAALQAKIDAGASATDLSTEVATLNAINAAVQAMDAKAKAANPPPVV